MCGGLVGEGKGGGGGVALGSFLSFSFFASMLYILFSCISMRTLFCPIGVQIREIPLY